MEAREIDIQQKLELLLSHAATRFKNLPNRFPFPPSPFLQTLLHGLTSVTRPV
jgi:hypothetical protein